MAAFLEGRIGFWDIQACNSEVLARIPSETADSLEAVLAADRNARDNARSWIALK